MFETENLRAVEDIVSSYEKRIENVGLIFDTVYSVFDGVAQESVLDGGERENLSCRVRDILARNSHLRKKDFNSMMQGILSAQAEREKEVKGLLKEYFNKQKTAAQTLREDLGKFRDSLAKGETGRVEEFQCLIKGIHAEQEKRKEEITAKLKMFQKERAELDNRLRELLERGNNLRVKDFKSMLQEFSARREERLALQKERKEEVAGMLAGFKKQRQGEIERRG